MASGQWRQVRLEAAHAKRGAQHPIWTIHGRSITVAVSTVVVLAGLVSGAAWVGRHVPVWVIVSLGITVLVLLAGLVSAVSSRRRSPHLGDVRAWAYGDDGDETD
jgi:hypothetical protein